MAPHSSTLAWKVLWMEEPGRLQSMVSLSETRLSDFTFTFHFRALEKAMATHSSVLAWRIPETDEPSGLPSMGLQSRTRLKQLSSSSSRDNTCSQRCEEKGTLVPCWWEYKLVQSQWKILWRFLQKLKIELPYDPAIPLLGIYPKVMLFFECAKIPC